MYVCMYVLYYIYWENWISQTSVIGHLWDQTIVHLSHLWELIIVFVWCWDNDWVSSQERCPSRERCPFAEVRLNVGGSSPWRTVWPYERCLFREGVRKRKFDCMYLAGGPWRIFHHTRDVCLGKCSLAEVWLFVARTIMNCSLCERCLPRGSVRKRKFNCMWLGDHD